MITESIRTAQQRGTSADAILAEILRQNPSKNAIFEQARAKGANSQQILDEIIKQNPSGPDTAPGQTGFADFVSRDVYGVGPVQKADGITRSIIQSTVGSKGILGVAQSPGRAVGAFQNASAAAQAGASNLERVGGLEKVNQDMIQKAMSLPIGDSRRTDLLKQVNNNIRLMQGGTDNAKEISTIAGERQITPGQVAGTAINAGITAATFGAGGLGVGLLSRMGESAIIGAGYKVAGNLTDQKPVGEGVLGAAALGAAVPFAGTLLSKLKRGTASVITRLGEKIQTSVIRPTASVLEDGFNVKTLAKYNLGGSLNQTLVKVNAAMNTLGKNLRELAAGSNTRINLSDVYDETISILEKGKNKTFGDNARIDGIISELKSEIARVSGGNPQVDVATAQEIKRAAGTLGSWVFGFADKDSNARQTVYTKFFQVMKKTIEKSDVGPEMGAINAKLQELIPVANAVVRRIPVADRNNALSLTDVMGLIGTVFDPRAAAITVINKASKSGRTGAALVKLGGKLKPNLSSMGITRRIFGK